MERIRVYHHGGPEQLKVEFCSPLPDLPASTLRVSVQCAGVTRSDTSIRAGKYDNLPVLPYTPGIDFAGTVEAVAEDILQQTRFKVGTRVFGMLWGQCGEEVGALVDAMKSSRGTYASHVIVTPDFDVIDILPDHIDFEAGAAATSTYLTAYRALFEAYTCQPRATVLVHGGSGGIGTAAIEMINRLGGIAIATAGSMEGMKVCKEAGARHVVNHAAKGYMEEVMDITTGQGVDAVLETCADRNLNFDINVLKNGGTIILVGGHRAAEIPLPDLISKEARIVGVSMLNSTRESLLKAQAYVLAGLKSRSLSPIVQSYRLEEASIAHEEILRPSLGGSAGRIVLRVQAH